MIDKVLAIHKLDNGMECKLCIVVDFRNVFMKILIEGITVEAHLFWPPTSLTSDVSPSFWPPLSFSGQDGVKKLIKKAEADIDHAKRQEEFWAKTRAQLDERLTALRNL